VRLTKTTAALAVLAAPTLNAAPIAGAEQAAPASAAARPFMFRPILTIATAASLALAASATAAQAPTLGPVTIIKAGQKTPVSVPGNHLLAGATIRRGTELRRWQVTLNGSSEGNVTLSCGPRGRHIGLAESRDSKVGFEVRKPAAYDQRTITVRAYAAPHVNPNRASGTFYALCEES
jgi:hypothetical protein